MKLVSNQTDEDIRRAHTLDDVEASARDLAANLIRVVRGAGRSYDLVGQAARLVEAAHEFREAHGFWPYDQIAAAIRFDREYYREGMSEADLYIDLGQTQAIQGALQVVASELLGQRTQVAAGRSELFDGILNVEKGRELNRKTFAPKPFSERTKTRKSTVKPKPKSPAPR